MVNIFCHCQTSMFQLATSRCKKIFLFLEVIIFELFFGENSCFCRDVCFWIICKNKALIKHPHVSDNSTSVGDQVLACQYYTKFKLVNTQRFIMEALQNLQFVLGSFGLPQIVPNSIFWTPLFFLFFICT